MKRRGLRRLADASRRVWVATYERVVPRTVPQPRCELADPWASARNDADEPRSSRSSALLSPTLFYRLRPTLHRDATAAVSRSA
jgi:hypothetical protein